MVTFSHEKTFRDRGSGFKIMFNFFKKKIANEDQFPEIVEKLLILLNKAQETAIGSIWRGLEGMNINIFSPWLCPQCVKS